MKVLYYFSSEIMPLPKTILDTFDKVITNIKYLDKLSDSLRQLSPDDIITFSIHTCNGVEQICECADDCGVDITLHLRKIDKKHLDDIRHYEYNRDVKIPKILSACGYKRVYFGEEYDEK